MFPSQFPLVRLAADGTVVQANAAAGALGIDHDLLAAADPGARPAMSVAIADGCEAPGEVRLRLDGVLYRLLLHPVGDGRQVEGVLAPVVREPAPAHESEALAPFVAQSPVCLLHLDADGVVTFESQRACRMLGYSAVGHAFASEDPHLDRAVDALLADGASFASLPCTALGADGPTDLVAHGNVVRSAAGEIVGAVVLAVVPPVSDTPPLSADPGRGAFISTVTHEVRNPLGVVNGFATMLSEELEEFAAAAGAEIPPPITEFVETIQANARRALDILADLADLARLEAGSLTVRCEPVSMHELVRRVGQAFVPSGEGEWSLALEPAADAMVMGDSHRIEQILNALLASVAEVGDTARLRLSLDPDWALVTVESDSWGADAASPLPADPNERYRRAGRGLAIAKGLAEAMGGSLTYEARPDGVRAFLLSLPRGTQG